MSDYSTMKPGDKEDEVWLNNSDAVAKFSAKLSEGWRKYVDLLGEVPHGTQQQMAALLELAQFRQFLGQGKLMASKQNKYKLLINQTNVAEGTLLTVIRALFASEPQDGQVVEIWQKFRGRWGLIDGCNWSPPDELPHAFNAGGVASNALCPPILCKVCGNVRSHKIHLALTPHEFNGAQNNFCIQCDNLRGHEIHFGSPLQKG